MDEVIKQFEQYFVGHWFDEIMSSDGWIFRFENNFGATIEKGPYTRGGKEGKYELALILFDKEDPTKWGSYYGDEYGYTDTLGYVDISDVTLYLNDIKGLP